MEVGWSGMIGLPAARPAARVPSPVPVPVPIPFPSTEAWTAVETAPKSEIASSATVPCTANGSPSQIGRTAVRAATKELAGERETSRWQNMEGMIAWETPLRLRSVTLSLVLVSKSVNQWEREREDKLKPHTYSAKNKGVLCILHWMCGLTVYQSNFIGLQSTKYL